MANNTRVKNSGITNHNAVDIHVGRRIRLRRNFLGMTQQDLARRLDVTFQQVQKYERGANRVSASRLWDISQIMKTEIGYFFDDMPAAIRDASPRHGQSGIAHQDALDHALTEISSDPLMRRETLELLRSYYLIKTPHIRKKMAMMIRMNAEPSQQDDPILTKKGDIR